MSLFFIWESEHKVKPLEVRQTKSEKFIKIAWEAFMLWWCIQPHGPWVIWKTLHSLLHLQIQPDARRKPYISTVQRYALWGWAHVRRTVKPWKHVLWSEKSAFLNAKYEKDNPNCFWKECVEVCIFGGASVPIVCMVPVSDSLVLGWRHCHFICRLSSQARNTPSNVLKEVYC